MSYLKEMVEALCFHNPNTTYWEYRRILDGQEVCPEYVFGENISLERIQANVEKTIEELKPFFEIGRAHV